MKIKTKTLLIAFIGFVFLAEGAILGYKYFKGSKHYTYMSRPCPNVNPDGVDVSHHQGKIDWGDISQDSGIQFAYIKATEGTTWQDKHFERNAREARKHGIKVGAYHLLSLNTSPETQVENYCRLVSKDDVDLIPAVDIEAALMNHKHSDRIKNYATRVCELLTKRYGRKPIIYTSSCIYNNYLYPDFGNYYLWISSYHRRCPILKGDSHTDIWQYTERGQLACYENPIDLNCFVNGMTIDKLEL